MKSKWLIVGAVSLALCGTAIADDDSGWRFWKGERDSRTDVAPVTNVLYKEECGTCHMPYQPGLLPERSWQKLMSNLGDHFGDNAELGKQEQGQILAYLTSEAADRSNYKRSRKFDASIAQNDAPIRITKTGYFIRKHDEVPLSVRTGNGQVKSMSNCDTCHTRAITGSYDEHEIKIPGMAKWED